MTDTRDFESELRRALGDAYELERELTGSGMSRVFVATERALNRRVVVKVLPPELAAGVNRERFQREIQLAAQLQHPHIVPLLMAGAAGDLLYFTMPFIEGESLRHAVHAGQRFSPREVVRILHDVSDALAYAHARGVIHRDIKPGNVLRSGSHALVTDFGVAKAISAALPAVGMTTSGMAIGTPQYMAPEQLAGDPAADHRVDIYAVGLLGYELLAGEAPFKATSPAETMAAQLTRVPEPISGRRPDVPPVLAALLSRCLAKNPADRPQTAAEMVTQLDDMDTSSGGTQPWRPPARSRRGLVVGALAVAVAATALYAWKGNAIFNRAPTGIPVTPKAPDTAVAPKPAVLSHDDSLAIARAIEQKFAERRAKADSTRHANAKSVTANAARPESASAAQMARLADSLRQEIQRAVLDSVSRVRGMGRFGDGRQFGPSTAALESLAARTNRSVQQQYGGRRPPLDERRASLSEQAFAERAANPGPPRRLFLSLPALGTRTTTFVGPAVDSLADSLRRSIARIGRYRLVDADSVRQVLQQTRSVQAIAQQMQVDLFASVYVALLPDSTVLWTITTRDLSAHSAYSSRTAVGRGPRNAMLADADSLVIHTLRNLAEMDRAPRRPSPPPAPGGPPG